MGVYITSRALRLVKIVFLCFVFLVVLGLQRACQLLAPAPAGLPAVCLAPAPLVWTASLRVRTSDTSRAAGVVVVPHLDRKRLARAHWRGFASPAYLVYPLPRPRKPLRDVNGNVIVPKP